MFKPRSLRLPGSGDTVNDTFGVSLRSLPGSSEVHAITREGLPHKQLATVAQEVATPLVIRQESAEAIVGVGHRRR